MCCEDICPAAVPRTVQRRRKHIPLGRAREERRGGGGQGKGERGPNGIFMLALPSRSPARLSLSPPVLFPSSDNHEFTMGTLIVRHCHTSTKHNFFTVQARVVEKLSFIISILLAWSPFSTADTNKKSFGNGSEQRNRASSSPLLLPSFRGPLSVGRQRPGRRPRPPSLAQSSNFP